MIQDLFPIQRKLMNDIEEKHPAKPNENRFNKKLVAILSEVGEASNELRTWKYWSVDQQPRFQKLLEELIDVLHYTLEFGILLKVEFYADEITPYKWDTIEEQFLALYNNIMAISHDEVFYLDLLNTYVGLIEMAGFTWDAVEQAYHEKVAVNYNRLETGY